MILYVVRHGVTECNARRLIQGHTDIPLNEEGIAQARETKQVLEGYSFDRVFVSPRKRAMQTAEIVTAGRGIPLVAAEALQERGYGEFEGRHKETFDYYGFWDYGKDLHYRDAENIRDFFTRVWSFIDLLADRFPKDKILLVTHAGVIRAIECYFHPDKADDQLGHWAPENCSVHEYEL